MFSDSTYYILDSDQDSFNIKFFHKQKRCNSNYKPMSKVIPGFHNKQAPK